MSGLRGIGNQCPKPHRNERAQSGALYEVGEGKR